MRGAADDREAPWGATDVRIPEILRIETPHSPGALASVLNVLSDAELVLEHVSRVRRDQERTLWEITIEIEAGAHAGLVERLNALPAVRSAAHALAAAAPAGQLLPDALEPTVHQRVSRAVRAVVHRPVADSTLRGCLAE